MKPVPLRKTAIALPEEVLAEIDRAARDRGESRSRFISRVLRLALRTRRDAEVTRRLNELFADESLQTDQREEAGELVKLVVDWSTERW
jgi:metal-responsive CopG/Arc/MetJ family transcriptional regulator